MAAQSHILDLDRLALGSGQGRRLEVDLDPGPIELGGNTYALARKPVAARVDVSRTVAGYAFRLRYEGAVAGTCVSCLADATVAVRVDAREVDQAASADEELRSPYVSEGELDLGAWARDALALALPQRFLCRPDCAGLCSVCGVSLNDLDPATHHHEPEPDPRWAKLRELKLD
jgi:uncharacterized protein